MLIRKLIEENVLEAKSGKYYAGDVLFSAGESPEFVYFFITGSATLTSRSGEELQLLVPGSFAGLTDILNERYTCSACANAPSEILKIRRQKLLDLIERNPALRVYFLKLMSKGLSRARPLYE